MKYVDYLKQLMSGLDPEYMLPALPAEVSADIAVEYHRLYQGLKASARRKHQSFMLILPGSYSWDEAVPQFGSTESVGYFLHWPDLKEFMKHLEECLGLTVNLRRKNILVIKWCA